MTDDTTKKALRQLKAELTETRKLPGISKKDKGVKELRALISKLEELKPGDDTHD